MPVEIARETLAREPTTIVAYAIRSFASAMKRRANASCRLKPSRNGTTSSPSSAATSRWR